jgi:hypothetical protein
MPLRQSVKKLQFLLHPEWFLKILSVETDFGLCQFFTYLDPVFYEKGQIF